MHKTFEEIESRRAEIIEEMDKPEADLEALKNELRQLAEDAAELRKQNQQAEQRRTAVANGAGTVVGNQHAAMPKALTMDELRADPRYVEAFANYVKDERKLSELRMLTTELVGSAVTTADKLPLPTIVQETIEYVWERDRVLSDRARWVSYRGIFEIPYEASADPAVIHAEGTAAPNEERLTIGTVTLTPAMIKKWVSITDEALKMKSEAFLRYVYEEITHQIVLKLENDIVANLIASTNAAGLTSVAVTSAPSADTVFNALAALAAEAQRPFIVMNKAMYFNSFMTLKDTAQRPIYNVVSENGRPTFYINGVEVLFNNSLPSALTTTAAVYAVLGDMDGYTINAPDGRDVDIVTDPYTLATEDRVRVIGKLYVGHGISRPGHFVRISGAIESTADSEETT